MIMINILLLKNSITPEHFTARLAQGNFASKSDIANCINKFNTDHDHDKYTTTQEFNTIRTF